MKILHINTSYGTFSTGTIMKNIHKCAEAAGFDSYIAFQKGEGELGSHSIEIGNYWDYKTHALLVRIAGKQAYYSRCSTSRFLKRVDEIKPDIVHFHNVHNNYLNLNMLLQYLAKNRIKTVITMHDCWLFTGGCFHYASVGCEKWKTGCGNCPKRYQDSPAYLYDASASILKDRKKYLGAIEGLTLVGCSEWIANECKQSVLKDKNIICIHNGFDIKRFKPTPSNLRERLGLMGKYVILGPAGKWLLDINKPTLDYFINKLPHDSVLLLFGSNGKEPVLNEKVMMYGYTKNTEELVQLYSMADVMINVSREDTLSSLNLECQACGTPVVTYDATGSKETVDGVSGFAVETGNYEQLYVAYEKVRAITKSDLTDGCRNWIVENFDSNKNYQKYIELYNAMTGK